MTKKKIKGNLSPEVLYKSILTPALQLGEKLMATNQGETVKKSLAALHAARGRLIRDNPTVDWPFKNVN